MQQAHSLQFIQVFDLFFNLHPHSNSPFATLKDYREIKKISNILNVANLGQL